MLGFETLSLYLTLLIFSESLFLYFYIFFVLIIHQSMVKKVLTIAGSDSGG
jgi:hypothetical protein